jgi:hypothetical protein
MSKCTLRRSSAGSSNEKNLTFDQCSHARGASREQLSAQTKSSLAP